MANHPIAGVTAEVMAALFDGAPTDVTSLWRGEVYGLPDDRELLPFVFLDLRFIAIFSTPINEAGGDEDFLATQAETWAGGFVPAPNSRLVKFCRAEAQDQAVLFKPDEWKLSKPRQIFEFAELLSEVMVQHAQILPPVDQYFFWPANAAVERLYQRVFRKAAGPQGLLPNSFEPILEKIGAFCGYKRI